MDLFNYDTESLKAMAKLVMDMHGYKNSVIDNFKFSYFINARNIYKWVDTFGEALKFGSECNLHYHLPNGEIMSVLKMDEYVNGYGSYVSVNTDGAFEVVYTDIELSVESYNKIINMDKLVSKI